MDRDLWRVEQYNDFLAARRELLAKAANEFLDSLIEGTVPETAAVAVAERTVEPIPGGITSEAEEEALFGLNEWVIGKGLPEGEFLFELTDPDSSEPIAVLDIAWPDGLQPGQSQPVAVLINEDLETIEGASLAGFKCFAEIETFKHHVEREVLAEVS